MPLRFESGHTRSPPEGFGKIVFTWKFGSVEVIDPAFTFTRL